MRVRGARAHVCVCVRERDTVFVILPYNSSCRPDDVVNDVETRVVVGKTKKVPRKQ